MTCYSSNNNVFFSMLVINMATLLNNKSLKKEQLRITLICNSSLNANRISQTNCFVMSTRTCLFCEPVSITKSKSTYFKKKAYRIMQQELNLHTHSIINIGGPFYYRYQSVNYVICTKKL